jgi:hypothetical protein
MPGFRRQAPSKRADDAKCQGLVQPKWIADRKRKLPHFKIGRAADRDCRRKLAWIAQPDDAEVVVRCRADNVRGKDIARGEAHDDFVGSADAMPCCVRRTPFDQVAFLGLECERLGNPWAGCYQNEPYRRLNRLQFR